MTLHAYLKESAALLHKVTEEVSEAVMLSAVDLIAESLESRGALLLCGNGGSASDAMHITGELVGKFLKERRALKAMCLSSNSAILTAWSNDYHYDTVFSRQVEAYGQAGDVLIGLSTSGNSENVVRAFQVARNLNMKTIAFTGQGGGRLSTLADILIAVPSKSTPLIQQAHICLYHYLCAEIETRFVV